MTTKEQIEKQIERISNAKPTTMTKALKESLEAKKEAFEGKTVCK